MRLLGLLGSLSLLGLLGLLSNVLKAGGKTIVLKRVQELRQF